jgi:hypothetical protein
MIEARKENNKYILIADKSSETYYIKDKIKALGGIWDGQHWIVDSNALIELKIPKTLKCRVAAHCHMPEEKLWLNEWEIKQGKVRLGCSMCDCPTSCGSNVEILEVLGEE